VNDSHSKARPESHRPVFGLCHPDDGRNCSAAAALPVRRITHLPSRKPSRLLSMNTARLDASPTEPKVITGLVAGPRLPDARPAVIGWLLHPAVNKAGPARNDRLWRQVPEGTLREGVAFSGLPAASRWLLNLSPGR
jgi:hypothetical protein